MMIEERFKSFVGHWLNESCLVCKSQMGCLGLIWSGLCV